MKWSVKVVKRGVPVLIPIQRRSTHTEEFALGLQQVQEFSEPLNIGFAQSPITRDDMC